MSVYLRSLACVALSAFAACGGRQPPPPVAEPVPTPTPAEPAQPSPPADDTVAAAVRAALGGDWDARYFDATVDLNGDGQHEVVTYVAGPMVCGTGGCPVFVFTPRETGLMLVSRLTVVQAPVRVAATSTNGWRDLVVGIGGGGIESGNALLRYDGKTYPSNPTVSPAEPVASLDGTKVLIAEFGSYTDGKPLRGASPQ